MKILLTVGHSILKSGACTSADGRPYGGVLEYAYNKGIINRVAEYLRAAGHTADVLICPELQPLIYIFPGTPQCGTVRMALPDILDEVFCVLPIGLIEVFKRRLAHRSICVFQKRGVSSFGKLCFNTVYFNIFKSHI